MGSKNRERDREREEDSTREIMKWFIGRTEPEYIGRAVEIPLLLSPQKPSEGHMGGVRASWGQE